EVEQLWSHICQHNGLSTCSHWQTPQLNCRMVMEKLISSRTGLNERIFIGWKISVTGVFHVSYGGAIEYRPGIIRKQGKCMSARRHLQILKIGSRMRMCLIRGFLLHYGHFRQWAGQMKMPKISSVIFRQMF